VCALEIEIGEEGRIGRLRGAKAHPYTRGVICEKVSRYTERLYHPERLLTPLKRKGSKGEGQWQAISWDDALDETAKALLRAEERYGAETVWPYHYAGTMGLVQRDGLNRLRHAKRYSRQYSTICTGLAWAGYRAGTGALWGVDPREMAQSDLIVIWGGNPVNTQVNVMTHVALAKKSRGTKVAVIDVYATATVEHADFKLLIKPGTDGALACAIMHVLFRDQLADWEYLNRYTDAPQEFEAHLLTRTPEWASAITGLSVEAIEEFAHAIGRTKRTFFRLGFGFTRSRNGAANMHAVLSIPAVSGAWAHEGGGVLHSNSGMYGLDTSIIEGLDMLDESTRILDQSRIGAVLNGKLRDLAGGAPVTALVVQNTNPVNVAPDQNAVRRGFLREDLFVCVHEQFMTDTAKLADIVLPATMFLEHDDLYKAGGHTHLMLGPKVVEPQGQCRSNHAVVTALARRLGAGHPAFALTECQIIDATLQKSGKGRLAELQEGRWLDCRLPFETAHFLTGFGHPDGKYRFKARWTDGFSPGTAPSGYHNLGGKIPMFPDHWAVIDEADLKHPFRLVTAPARTFLNSSFSETPASQAREGRPELLMHPEDVAACGLKDGGAVRAGNAKGQVLLHLRASERIKRGVVVAEGLWANSRHANGAGINTLTSAIAAAPLGGAAFHDTRVWVKAATRGAKPKPRERRRD
jgi:anaerobic selenocysteine-containing dehydrogenase